MEDKIITHTQTENTSGLCLFCTDEKKEIKIKVNDDSKYEKYNICEVQIERIKNTTLRLYSLLIRGPIDQAITSKKQTYDYQVHKIRKSKLEEEKLISKSKKDNPEI